MTKHERDQALVDEQRRAARDRIGARVVNEFRQIMREAPGTDPQAAMRRAYANSVVLDHERYDDNS